VVHDVKADAARAEREKTARLSKRVMAPAEPAPGRAPAQGWGR
jgi:hypothetical protein